ncbi:uncharacterized protein LOC111342099 isoform X1 [Stylophora pistillata]|uniref:DED domain-containing protein n=1 Tax=Stylophora pistillata TaxID=50429 RepID=A0A2B4RJH0_STYPI|nr:uncharacterized protein LOC111342099 isoform X1 [Stylophora pistillata]PFX16508.1 hypothetical protein AWC38_SpisGene19212 [Stylophora pistillata]
MSTTEYNHLLFEISERIDELNALQRLVFMCRGKLASGNENIHDALALFKELEENDYLGVDRLKLMKELLKSVKEWTLFGKVKKLENKRKEYKALLEKIIRALDELNDLERLITICEGNIREESEGNIDDVRSLFEELEKHENLGIDCLDVVKVILAEMGKTDLLREVEEFEERRDQEDESEAKREQRAALMSSVRSTLSGVVNIKTVFQVVAGGLTVVSAMEVLSRWSSFDQLVAAVQTCVLPAGTRLVQISDGCVCLTVQAESLSALKSLWKLYQDGTLQKHLHDFFVTDEVRELADGEDVEVNVTIEEEEYQKACLDLVQGALGGATIDNVEKGRRNSDSAVYFNAKELPLSRIQCLETEVKYLHKRIILLEGKKDNMGSYAFEEKEIAPLGPPDENFDYKSWDATKMEKDTTKVKGSEGRHSELTIKSMDTEKMDMVQRYLENVPEKCSVITDASDSGLGTRTAVSEEETEDGRDPKRLCLRDLRKESINELDRRLGVDRVGSERVFQFFGLKSGSKSYRYRCVSRIAQSFPDTPVDLIRQCFEALQMYDLVDLLEKAVKPISLHPVLSPEELQTLRTDNLPTKCHNNVVVLVVNDSTDNVLNQKIEAFFKELNSQNVVTVIESSSSKENRKALSDLKMKRMQKERLVLEAKELISPSNYIRRKQMQWKEPFHSSRTGNFFRKIENDVEELSKQIEMDKPLMEKLLRETEKAKTITTSAMDNWIQNQEKFTAIVLVFVIDERKSIYNYDDLAECVASKLTSLPHHTKVVVGAPRSIIIDKVPEILSVGSPGMPLKSSIYNSMIEIFFKRYHQLDLISMMRELKRTCPELNPERRMDVIRSNLSTLPSFEKRKAQELEQS